MPTEAGNEVLAQLLTELGWSPRALARRINRAFGAGTVAETAPYHWRDAARIPRPPLPQLAAWVLSRGLGRPVTVAELWQGHAAQAPLTLPADAEMKTAWTRGDALAIMDDWVVSGLLDRRNFLAVSGAALTTVAHGYTGAQPARLARAVRGGAAGGPLLDQIGQSIPLLQRLDDAAGGGSHLPYIGAQFRAVALLLRQGGHREQIERRLFTALADIGQLAGWMAFDAGRNGLAQRYFFTALRAAHQAGYQPMAAHILADLAFQAATVERSSDAVALGEAAARLADRSAAKVRASVCTRLAYGYAVAGRGSDFDRAYHRGLDALTGPAGPPEPAWMYYLTPGHLDTQAGYALIHAAALAPPTRSRRTQVRRGARLLAGGAHDAQLDDSSQRRALFEGAWLAVAAAQLGDHERACTLGRTAVARTTSVRSARSMHVLRILDARLSRASRNEHVRDFRPELRAALARSASAA